MQSKLPCCRDGESVIQVSIHENQAPDCERSPDRSHVVEALSVDEEALHEILMKVAGDQEPPCFNNWSLMWGFHTRDMEDAFSASLALPQLRGLAMILCAAVLLFLVCVSRIITGSSQHQGVYKSLVDFLVTPMYGLFSIAAFITCLYGWNDATRYRRLIHAMVCVSSMGMTINGIVLLLAYAHRMNHAEDMLNMNNYQLAGLILHLFPICSGIVLKVPVYQCMVNVPLWFICHLLGSSRLWPCVLQSLSVSLGLWMHQGLHSS